MTKEPDWIFRATSDYLKEKYSLKKKCGHSIRYKCCCNDKVTFTYQNEIMPITKKIESI